MGLKRAAQTVAIEGLGQVVGRTKRKSLLLFVEDAQHEHRDGGELRIGFQLLRTAQPSMRGITTSRVIRLGLNCRARAQALGGIGRGERIETLTREKAPHEVARIADRRRSQAPSEARPRSRWSYVRRFRARVQRQLSARSRPAAKR